MTHRSYRQSPLTDSHLERFWAKVNKGAAPPEYVRDLGPCWLWTGGVTDKGYGLMSINGLQEGAHRLSWEIHNGEKPALSVLHHCDVRRCINPAHLFLGTSRDNALDMNAKGRKAPIAGRRNPSVKLTEEQVREIRRRHAEGVRTGILANAFGVHRSQILRINKGVNWTCVA